MPSPDNRYGYNGKELQQEIQWLDYGARMYDAALGRFFTQDRFADKYLDFSPYQYAAGNPVKYIDVNGDSIWVNYGRDQRVFYENGTFYNEDGTEYDGDNKFIAGVGTFMNQMNSVENGQKVLASLSGSKNDFTFSNIASTGGDNTLSFKPNDKGGGVIAATMLLNSETQDVQKLESTAHEIFHAYQYENGQGGNKVNGVNNEVGAYVFAKSISVSVGYAISAFGTRSLEGQAYDAAMNNILWSDELNMRDYQNAIINFKKGSVGNSDGNGIYNTFGINNRLSNPLIKKFIPLIR